MEVRRRSSDVTMKIQTAKDLLIDNTQSFLDEGLGELLLEKKTLQQEIKELDKQISAVKGEFMESMSEADLYEIQLNDEFVITYTPAGKTNRTKSAKAIKKYLMETYDLAVDTDELTSSSNRASYIKIVKIKEE